jgi:hypothetical protein
MAAAPGYNEATDGELSLFHHYPTPVHLNIGATLIQGSTRCTFLAPNQCDQGDKSEPLPESVFDRDFWTVTVPSGYRLTAVTVVRHRDPLGQISGSFMAVAKGSRIERIDSDSGLLGATLIGAGGAGPGKPPPFNNALLYLGAATLGGGGFDGPLRAGTYTFWYQEASGPTDYAFRFVTKPVPEPATIGLTAAGLVMVGLVAVRHRRRQTG